MTRSINVSFSLCKQLQNDKDKEGDDDRDKESIDNHTNPILYKDKEIVKCEIEVHLLDSNKDIPKFK